MSIFMLYCSTTLTILNKLQATHQKLVNFVKQAAGQTAKFKPLYDSSGHPYASITRYLKYLLAPYRNII